jgi:hypothetical protein
MNITSPVFQYFLKNKPKTPSVSKGRCKIIKALKITVGSEKKNIVIIENKAYKIKTML